jgi:hypothetical protein
MCNLYSITTNQAAIAALFRVMNRYVGNLPPMLGVFPDFPAPWSATQAIHARRPGGLKLPDQHRPGATSCIDDLGPRGCHAIIYVSIIDRYRHFRNVGSLFKAEIKRPCR